MRCHICGRENSDIYKFCVNCGAELAESRCVACGVSIRPGAAFCGKCGAKQVKPQKVPPVRPVADADTVMQYAAAPETQKKHKSAWKTILIVLLILILLGAGAAVAGDYFGIIDLSIWHKSNEAVNAEPEETLTNNEDSANGETSKNDQLEQQTTVATKDEAPFEKQTITVKYNGNSATLTLSEWENGEWTDVLSIPAYLGKNGISSNKQEGDYCTPAGTFHILYYLDTEMHSGTKLNFHQIYPNDVWVTDPGSTKYNTVQSANATADWDKAMIEDMYNKFENGYSSACIMFDYNGDGISCGDASRGSDIFIDGVGPKGNVNSGYGDIKISATDMERILSYLDSSKNPIITIE